MLTLINLDEAKKYLRIDLDDTEEDQDIEQLIIAAETYLKNGGCILQEGDEVAKLSVKMLVVHWYENREPIGEDKNLSYGLRSLITQLQFCYPGAGEAQ